MSAGGRSRRVLTIGVYGFSAESFMAALRDAGAGVLYDVRDRRAVRGSEYAWANHRRLVAALEGAGIQYQHLRELAPPAPMRALQQAADRRAKIGPRARGRLAPEFARAYERERLVPFDLAGFAQGLLERATPAVLMCVEGKPAACHRSLIAARLERDHGFAVTHLRA